MLSSSAAHQVLCRLLTHALEVGKRPLIEPVEIGQVLHQSAVDELLDQLGAEPFDVHRIAVREPADPLLELVWAAAGRVHAVEVDLARGTFDGRAAARASRWELILRFGSVACVGLDPDHLRDDLAGLLDHDGVADLDVLAEDLVGVVQARPLHGRAGKDDGSEVGDGGQLAGLADLDVDPDQLRDRLLGLVLERNHPAGTLAPRPQAGALAEVVEP